MNTFAHLGQSISAATGKGVKVLVLDSGVELDHPFISSSSVECWCVEKNERGLPAIVKCQSGDSFGHGTAVAGLILEYAPDVELHSLRVLGANLKSSSEFVLAALNWGINQKFSIVNCSFGTGNRFFLEGYKRVVDHAFCNNTWIVSACSNNSFQAEDYPSFFPTVLATDAGDCNGLSVLRRTGSLVEFSVGGENVRVAWKNKGFRRISGSSFAAPHLTALCARIREIKPKWNACEVKSALYEIAEQNREVKKGA